MCYGRRRTDDLAPASTSAVQPLEAGTGRRPRGEQVSFTYRTIAPDEFPAFAEADSLAFGHLLSDADVEIERASLEFDRAIAAFEGEALVGTTASLTMELTVPGGTRLPTGGLTWTSVVPTHRRRGILSGMMERQLALSRERAEPLVALLASEGVIYGRFGYGPATWSVGTTVSTVSSGFRDAVAADGRCRLLSADEATSILPGVFDRHRLLRHGSLSRTAGLWHVLLADPEHHRDGAGRLYHVAHENPDGLADGYASYRLTHSWSDDGIPQGTLTVTELLAVTSGAYASLWRYCLDMDLVATVTAESCAPDEPVRWLLADPRQWRTIRVMDYLWLRLLDVSACLRARRYAADGALVLEVHESRPGMSAGGSAASDTGGPRRYLLEAGREGADCAPTTRSADLVLGIAELGAVYLGGVSFASLSQAGRIQETVAGKLRDGRRHVRHRPAALVHHALLSRRALLVAFEDTSLVEQLERRMAPTEAPQLVHALKRASPLQQCRSRRSAVGGLGIHEVSMRARRRQRGVGPEVSPVENHEAGTWSPKSRLQCPWQPCWGAVQRRGRLTAPSSDLSDSWRSPSDGRYRA